MRAKQRFQFNRPRFGSRCARLGGRNLCFGGCDLRFGGPAGRGFFQAAGGFFIVAAQIVAGHRVPEAHLPPRRGPQLRPSVSLRSVSVPSIPVATG